MKDSYDWSILVLHNDRDAHYLNYYAIISDTSSSYLNFSSRLFKTSSVIGIFQMPLLDTYTTISPLHTNSTITNEPHWPIDPWVVPYPLEVEYFGEKMPLLVEDISSSKMPLTPINFN